MRSILILGILGAGCGGTPPPQPEAVSAPLEKRLLEIARTYEAYGRVDDETRWAPELCRQPIPGRARFSRPAGEHGQKLYALFAGNRNAYVRDAAKPQPVGQVLVKESWVPKEVPAPAGGSPGHREWISEVHRDGKVYRASERAGLFIMVKTGGPEGETDQGWIYGTVSTDGKVTSAGRVASCMSCHQDAKNDRLFGIRWAD